MDVGIKQAKTDLARLILQVQQGKRVFLMNRGKRIAELVPVRAESQPDEDTRGLGLFKDKIRLPAGWDTQEARRESSAEVVSLMGNTGVPVYVSVVSFWEFLAQEILRHRYYICPDASYSQCPEGYYSRD